jgi:hypothetical protein
LADFSEYLFAILPYICNSSAGKLELNSLSIGLFDHNNGSKENDLNIFPLYHSTNWTSKFVVLYKKKLKYSMIKFIQI